MAAPVERSEFVEYTSTQRWLILIALMLGTVMQVIDTSIVNVAIPTMMGTLGASLTQISWVSTGYIIANVIMLPLTGWITIRFGRKQYLTASIILFTVASFFCGTAHSLGMLVFFRVVQGIGGAALLSTAQATMMEIFPPQQLAMVQAIYGIGVMVGPTIGPTLGGWITDNYSWPWIFYINLPIGIAAAIMSFIFIHNSRYTRERRGGVDFVGIGLLAIGLGCLQLMLEKGNDEGWFTSNYICWLTGLAVVGIVAFVIWELSIPYPAVNLRVLRHRGFAAGTAFGAALGVGLYGGIYILPVFLQQIRHYTAQQTGIILLPGAIATAIAMPIVGRLSSRFTPRLLVAVGSLTFVVSMLMLRNLTTDTAPGDLFWSLVLRGASMGFLFVPLTLATLMGLKGTEIVEGTGLFNLSRQLGGSIGIALLSTFIEHQQAQHRLMLFDRISVFNPLALQRLTMYQQYLMSQGSAANIARQQALKIMTMVINNQATVMAFIDAILLIGAIFVVSMPLLLLFNKLPASAMHGHKIEVAAE